MTKEEQQERRQRGSQGVAQLLQERSDVLAKFCTLAGHEPYTENPGTVYELKKFLQRLVDYIALGHFEVYDHIAEGKERRISTIKVAHEVYPSLSETTDSCVGFNDKYDGIDSAEDLVMLAEDLNALGEALAQRADLEDQLIATLVANR